MPPASEGWEWTPAPERDTLALGSSCPLALEVLHDERPLPIRVWYDDGYSTRRCNNSAAVKDRFLKKKTWRHEATRCENNTENERWRWMGRSVDIRPMRSVPHQEQEGQKVKEGKEGRGEGGELHTSQDVIDEWGGAGPGVEEPYQQARIGPPGEQDAYRRGLIAPPGEHETMALAARGAAEALDFVAALDAAACARREREGELAAFRIAALEERIEHQEAQRDIAAKAAAEAEQRRQHEFDGMVEAERRREQDFRTMAATKQHLRADGPESHETEAEAPALASAETEAPAPAKMA